MADANPTAKQRAQAADTIARTTGQDADEATIEDRAEVIEGQLTAKQIDTLVKKHTPDTPYEVLHMGVDRYTQGQEATFPDQDAAGIRRLLRLGAIGPQRRKDDEA